MAFNKIKAFNNLARAIGIAAAKQQYSPVGKMPHPMEIAEAVTSGMGRLPKGTLGRAKRGVAAGYLRELLNRTIDDNVEITPSRIRSAVHNLGMRLPVDNSAIAGGGIPRRAGVMPFRIRRDIQGWARSRG
jgi:hypothetical protein